MKCLSARWPDLILLKQTHDQGYYRHRADRGRIVPDLLGSLLAVFSRQRHSWVWAVTGNIRDSSRGIGIQRPGIFGILAGLLLLFDSAYAVPGLSLLVIIALATALRYTDLRDVLPQVACAFLGALYTFAPWHFATVLRAISVHWLLFALALNWAGDSVAYYVGKSFGKHRLAPVVSPKKSWEGAVGSVAGSVLFGYLYMGHFMPSAALWKVAVIAIAANIAGQFGDLAESAMKRGAGCEGQRQYSSWTRRPPGSRR